MIFFKVVAELGGDSEKVQEKVSVKKVLLHGDREEFKKDFLLIIEEGFHERLAHGIWKEIYERFIVVSGHDELFTGLYFTAAQRIKNLEHLRSVLKARILRKTNRFVLSLDQYVMLEAIVERVAQMDKESPSSLPQFNSVLARVWESEWRALHRSFLDVPKHCHNLADVVEDIMKRPKLIRTNFDLLALKNILLEMVYLESQEYTRSKLLSRVRALKPSSFRTRSRSLPENKSGRDLDALESGFRGKKRAKSMGQKMGQKVRRFSDTILHSNKRFLNRNHAAKDSSQQNAKVAEKADASKQSIHYIYCNQVDNVRSM